MKPTAVSPHYQTLVENELLSGETLKWIGQPQPFRMARQNITQSLFAIFWLGIVIFMYMQVTTNFMRPSSFSRVSSGFGGFSSMFQLVLGIFFLVGLGMLFSPLINAFLATQTVYAITDRRMLTIKEYGISALNLVFNRSIVSFGEKDIQRVERRDLGGDVGDVIIGYETRTRRHRSSNGFYRTSTYTVPIGFLGVHNVREVEALMLETFMSDDPSEPENRKKNSLPAWYSDDKPQSGNPAPSPRPAPDKSQPTSTTSSMNPAPGKPQSSDTSSVRGLDDDYEAWRNR